MRLHGAERWYRHDYGNEELAKWAERIRRSRAKHVFVYFNNDYEAYAPRMATELAERQLVDLKAGLTLCSIIRLFWDLPGAEQGKPAGYNRREPRQ